MSLQSRRSRLLGPLLAVTLAACGAKTGIDDSLADGGLCPETCPESTFCEPICLVDGVCVPWRAPSCDDGDACTVDRCDLELDRCVNDPALVDEDGDGALAPISCGGTDCDDEDPLIFPGAQERCNGIDDDCDELIDEGASLEPWDREVTVAASETTDSAASLVWADDHWIYGWWDYRDGDADVYLQSLSLEGEPLGEPRQITTAAGDGYGPSMVWTGFELGITWSDRRQGNFEIFFARLTGDLERLTDDIRITDDPEWSLYANIAWSGREYLLIWQDERTLAFEAWAQRIGADGPVGDPQRLSDAGARWMTAESPTVAFDGRSYHVAWLEGNLGQFVVRHTRYDQLLERQGSTVFDFGGAGTAAAPSIAASPGGVAIAWELEAFGRFSTMVVVLDTEGEPIVDPFPIPSPSVGVREPSLIWDNDGFVLVTSEYRSDFDLSYTVIAPSGSPTLVQVPFVEAAGDSVGAALALGAGEVGVAWSDTRRGSYDALFTRLLCAGL